MRKYVNCSQTNVMGETRWFFSWISDEILFSFWQIRSTCSRSRHQASLKRLQHSIRHRPVDDVQVHQDNSDGKVYHHRRLSSPNPAVIRRRCQMFQTSETLTVSRSEPDLMRCGRIIRDAYKLSFDEYNRRRKQFIWKMFFCSVNELNIVQPVGAVVSANGRSKYTQRRESRTSCSSRVSSRCTSRITRSRRTSKSSGVLNFNNFLTF